MPPLLTKEIFMSKSVKIHGDKYDYSLVAYTGQFVPVKIICKKHGLFLQSPKSHMKGCGCSACGKEKVGSMAQKRFTKSVDSFIEEALLLHHNKYSYDKVNMVNRQSRIIITCPIHGDFQQRASAHLDGQGCPKCARLVPKKGHKYLCGNKRYTQEEFLNKAFLKHHDLYDYSKTVYNKSRDKVIITCKKHGDFLIQAGQHLLGVGCHKCANDNMAKNKTIKQHDYIQKCVDIHSGKYDYSLVKYNGSFGYVSIICPTHGVFKQMAFAHAKGQGCPQCSDSKGEKRISSFLNDNDIVYKRQHKLGAKNIRVCRYDFFLPLFNLCVEYHGIQHYTPISIFNGLSGFLNSLKRDAIKKWYCIFNNIDLLVIPYWEKDVEGVLKHKLGLL